MSDSIAFVAGLCRKCLFGALAKKTRREVKEQPETEIQPETVTEMKPSPKSPVALCRETLAELTGAIRKSGLLTYLRDRETDYDSAAKELDSEPGFYIDEIARASRIYTRRFKTFRCSGSGWWRTS